MLTKDPRVFEQSDNPRELVSMARIYAASEDPADQAVLFRQLNSRDFLTRLNTDEEYIARHPRALEVARVIKTLRDQPHRAAIDTIVALTEADVFQSYYPLVELNIAALAADRPARPPTIAYWDRQSHPTSCNIDLVVDAIFWNGSEPALRLFERKMNDPAHDSMRKIAWLRDPALRHRNDVGALDFWESALTAGTLDESWHNPLIEALFDYNQGWYPSEESPEPPNRLAASSQAKELMGRIGRHALHRMRLRIPGLAAKIKLALKQVGENWDEDEPPNGRRLPPSG